MIKWPCECCEGGVRHELTVKAIDDLFNYIGVPISLDLADSNGAQNGITQFLRVFLVDSNLHVIAPNPMGAFVRWDIYVPTFVELPGAVPVVIPVLHSVITPSAEIALNMSQWLLLYNGLPMPFLTNQVQAVAVFYDIAYNDAQSATATCPPSVPDVSIITGNPVTRTVPAGTYFARATKAGFLITRSALENANDLAVNAAQAQADAALVCVVTPDIVCRPICDTTYLDALLAELKILAAIIFDPAPLPSYYNDPDWILNKMPSSYPIPGALCPVGQARVLRSGASADAEYFALKCQAWFLAFYEEAFFISSNNFNVSSDDGWWGTDFTGTSGALMTNGTTKVRVSSVDFCDLIQNSSNVFLAEVQRLEILFGP